MPVPQVKRKQLLNNMRKHPAMYLMVLPGIVWYIVFRYGPIWGVVIAFQDFQPHLGFLRSPWVGFENFVRYFKSPAFFVLLRNTLRLSLASLVINFPIPIVLALLLNEVRAKKFKKMVQTVLYLPHFLSWVIIGGITIMLFSIETGAINNIINAVAGKKFDFLGNPRFLTPLYVGQIIWKEAGYGTIIYLSAMTAIPLELYEAAEIDGCGRLRKMASITLPSIKRTIIVLLLLRISSVLETNFEQVMMLRNALNNSVSEVFSTYIYELGVLNGYLSLTTAIGLFNSVVAVMLLFGANRAAKIIGEEGIF